MVSLTQSQARNNLMTKRFTQIMENMRGLIKDDSWSASSGFLLAVSGGMDSMCMADLFLSQFGSEAFAVAHCNFHLRGEESDGDEVLVRNWADSNGVRFHRIDFDTEGYAADGGISIEMAARELRYGWFARLCGEFGYRAVVVAHNANDNAETLVLNLLRGTGLKGLHSMAEVSVLGIRTDNDLHWPLLYEPAAAGCALQKPTGLFADRLRPLSRGWQNANSGHLSAPYTTERIFLLRPLLSFSRKQIEGHVFANKVPYRDDSTNALCDYKRNRVRNEAFPIFEKINPSFVRSLNREIGYFSEAGDIVDEWCQAQLPDVVGIDGEVVRISLSALMDRRQWRYLLYYILEPYGFNSQTLASIESLLESDRTVSGKRFDSPTHRVLVERSELIVLPRETAGQAGSDERERSDGDGRTVIAGSTGNLCMPVRGAGVYNFNGARWQVEVLEWKDDMPLKQPTGILIADADKLLFPFVCRRWRQGDWFIPFGMNGKKKVSDLFADLKYGTLEKETAVMIVDTRSEGLAETQHIAGVMGVRLDDRYKVTPTTKTIIRIEILNNTETL